MNEFVPSKSFGDLPESEQFRLQMQTSEFAERRARKEVRAATWRAREIAEVVFGRVIQSSLVGLRLDGRLRGLMRLDVPFVDLHAHEDRQAQFIAAVNLDPILKRVSFVYVIGPESP